MSGSEALPAAASVMAARMSAASMADSTSASVQVLGQPSGTPSAIGLDEVTELSQDATPS